MIRPKTQNIYQSFLRKLALLLALYTLTRLVFYFYNYSSFSGLSFGELIKIMFFGLRFDFASICMTNPLLFLLMLLPFNFVYHPSYQRIFNFFFIVVNSIAFASNIADIAYYQFTLKRSTFDVFAFITTGSDTLRLIPQFLKDFWLLFLFWFSTIFILIYQAKKENLKVDKIKFIYKLLIFLVVVTITVFGIRGGFQYRPLHIYHAGNYTTSENIPLIINTPFSIIKTIDDQTIEEYDFFKDKSEVSKYFNPIHKAYSQKITYFNKIHKPNFVLIILEGFSKEHIGWYNKDLDSGKYKCYTPFLDSLLSKSIVFENTYANGKKSIEAMPAIIAAIPTLMNNPYITSSYSGNKIKALPSLMQEMGYYTAFFHGGNNGTMGFESFAKLSGYKEYLGKSEYPNNNDYDGNWGIWDEPFLQFMINKIDSYKKPFFATVFTLSSHHPFKVPEKYIGKFDKGTLDIHQSLGYADYALKQFFKEASKKEWYDSTIFIFTADHTSEAYYEKYKTRKGMYEVPLFFYSSLLDSAVVLKQVSQQMDIMPSILHICNYNKDFFAFGNSVFDTSSTYRYAVNFINNSYQLIDDKYSLQFDGKDVSWLGNHTNDIYLSKNIWTKDSVNIFKPLFYLKALLQTYNNGMITNQLTLEKKK